MTKHRTRLLSLGALGSALLTLPGCMQAERVAYERHLTAVIAPMATESVALGVRSESPTAVASADTGRSAP